MAYATVAQLRRNLPQVPELGQQRITIVGDPGGGTFTLGYEGTAASSLVVNATAKEVQLALRSISDIGSSGVKVRGRPGGPWIAQFQGDLLNDAGPITLESNDLIGGTDPDVVIVPDTDDDLQNALDRATDIIRNVLRAEIPDHEFDFADYVSGSKLVRGYWSERIQIPRHLIGSITLIEQEISQQQFQIIDGWIEEPDGRLRSYSGWTDSIYRITADWGYGSSIPDSIVELTLEIAANIYRTRNTGGYIEITGVDGSGAIRNITGLTKQQELILGNIRNQLVNVSV